MQRRTARLATAAIAMAGAVVVWAVSTQVFPHHSLNHDEGVYLQQAAMLLDGQLFLRPPVDGVFRPWFFVEDGDRLYPKYTPVPAGMFALGRLFGGYRLALVGIAAGTLALIVAVVRESFDRQTGLLAGAFVLASPLFVLDSAAFLPYAPTTLLNVAFAYGYLRADRSDDNRFAALAGAAIGLAFFARPYTAILFAAPFVGHALWTLSDDWRAAIHRQAVTALLGGAGVASALGYNVLITGSPLIFPYHAFAPLDGLGFGERRILGHEVVYTVELALRANRKVVELFLSEWIAGGSIGAALAVIGIALTVRRGPSPRELVLGGLFVSVIVGNVYFWGNFNILGEIDRAGDGLVSVFGPFYHFDLLVPTAAFAATGAVRGGRLLRRITLRVLDRRSARVALALAVVASASSVGVVTAGNFDEHLEENLIATETYEVAYEPFEGGPPAHSLILLPDPYGDWLNHPFQRLRNDPGFDGRAVYALDERPFAVVDEFPDRSVYRYGYRGVWAPYAGSPRAARLQEVRDVAGPRVRLETTVGIPDGAHGVTVRIATDDGTAYYVAPEVPGELAVDLLLGGERVRVAGDVRPVTDDSLALDDRDDLRLTVFVDRGTSGSFSYRIDLPVAASGDRVRALTPRVERCRSARTCGGAAAYIPETAPDGVFVRTRLVAREPNA